MNIDWNYLLDRSFKLLKEILKPSLAKAISIPLLLAGIGILNSPWWLGIVNWWLNNQEFFPQFKGPISEPEDRTGWIFITLSILVYSMETWKVIRASNVENAVAILDTINELPQKTADIVVEDIKKISFSAPHIIDEKINKQITELQSLRFFSTYPKEEKSIQLANDIIEGELAGGSPTVKALGLALSARYLSVGESLDKAKSYLNQSRMLAHVPEARIAEAFIKAAEFSVADGISILANDSTFANYSAIFMLKRNREGSKLATTWLDNAGLTALNLDVDGQISYISALLEMHDWVRALKVVCLLHNENPVSSPALAQVTAFTFLTSAIKAVELRESVMQQIPFAAESFPLSDDLESIELRNKAIVMFKLCAALAKGLKAHEVVEISNQYALWLELRNPDTFEIAKGKLNNYFSDSFVKCIEYLPLAFAFRIDVDYQKVEEEVNRQTALCHDNNLNLGLARFVLALNQKGYPKVIDYINDHREQLMKHVNPGASVLEIEALAKAGLTEDAEVLLSRLDESGTISREVKNLRNIIASVKGDDPLALAISQYNQTRNVSDLAQLVNLLERSELKDKYRSYTLELFDITGTEYDALRVANATSVSGHFSELHSFLVDNFDLVKRSEPLMCHWAWSLFRKGDFTESKKCLLKLKKSNTQYLELQQLEINLAIYTGNWDALTVIVENKWENRSDLSPEELMQAAQLAKAQSPRRAKEILEYATLKFPEDPRVLASAYFTATKLGWENNASTSDWLNKAAMLSNDEGPLHMASFDELKDMMASQRERNDKVYQAYEDGTAPIFTIAKLLNRSLSDFYLIQPIENLKSTDIRKKSFIGTFHSTRKERVMTGEVVSIDTSSVLVLGYLGLLDLLFDTFSLISVPHSMMRWLYDEKQKIAFHQPSQIQKAKELEALVSDDFIKIIEPKGINQPELALSVGDELAFLLENAKNNSSVNNQILVICTYPVYKIGGFREQVFDTSRYDNNLSSCITLVKKLKDIEVITEDEYQKASSYLLQHDQEWPSSPMIDDCSTIYLDSLSLTYLMAIGMLDKFKNTKLSVFVHKSEFENFKRLRSFDSTIREADIKIEEIRNKFIAGIQSSKVVFSSMQISILGTEKNRDETVKPIEEFFQTLSVSDAALVDDRFMNKHSNITIDDKTIPIYTSLDFIETLYDNQLITKDKKFACRAKLREAGFGLVPISIDELNHNLAKSSIVDGILRPTKELKLIKENLSLLKINRLIKLPRDADWLHNLLQNLASALKLQWTFDISTDIRCARANWLYGLLDFRGWSHCMDIRSEGGMAYIGEIIRANALLIAPEGLIREVENQYNEWLEERVLSPLKNSDMASYVDLVESIKYRVEAIASEDLLEGGSGE